MKTDRAVRDFIASRVLLRPATLRWYGRLLGRFARVCPELPQEAEGVALFLNSLQGQGLSDETVHGYWRALRALYRDLELRTGAPNPLQRMRAPRCRRRVMRTFQPQELFQVLARPLTVRNRTLLALLLDSGVRAGEVVGLEWSDVSEEFIHVDGKTGERLVPISPQVQTLLRLLRADAHGQTV
ncbi:MAG: tyrosine-type recombinase/integrase, partial [Chloroflexota bacterium]|nr:tyrosine-type recombinase/integrase [Chloroflexota bacterium]